MASQSFTDLIVWQKAHQLALNIYRTTSDFPKEELYGLVSQLRRSAVSIPANIAEGYRRRTKADKAKFMNIAEGSFEESRYYLILANDLEYADTKPLMPLVEDISRLLKAYTNALLR